MKLTAFLLIGFALGLAESRSLSLRSVAGGVVSEKEDLPAPSLLERSSSSKTVDDRSLTGLFTDASEEVVGACPYEDTDACTVWTDLRDGYADLFNVSLAEADPDVWMLSMTLDGAGAGLGPHGPFSYVVETESEDLTDQVKQEMLNQGGSLSDIEGYGVTIRMGTLSLTVGVKSLGVGGSLLSFDPLTPPPDADPAWPIKFLVDHVDPDASDERRLATCSINPDDYVCGASPAPACEPSCDDDPLNGNDMDVPCWDNAAQIACNTYQTNMANACSTYNTEMENCEEDHRTQQGYAVGIYTATILVCAASTIWSFGVAAIPCLIGAKTAHLTAMGAILLVYKTCRSGAANTLDTDQQNAENTRITDLENAMISCCTVSCGTTSTESTSTGSTSSSSSTTTGSTTGSTSCTNDSNWKTEAHGRLKTCNWVNKSKSTRCSTTGTDGRPATEGCADYCDPDCNPTTTSSTTSGGSTTTSSTTSGGSTTTSSTTSGGSTTPGNPSGCDSDPNWYVLAPNGEPKGCRYTQLSCGMVSENTGVSASVACLKQCSPSC